MIGRLIIACTAVVALTVAPAVFEGIKSHRWGQPPDMNAAAEQLKNFPRDFGRWTFVRDCEPIGEPIARELKLAGSLSRDYVNREDGTTVSLLLMVGDSGPLIQHPPYICYANRANQQVGDMTKLYANTTNPPSEFNLLVYRRPQAVSSDRFLVAYSMAVGPTWSSPNMPRLEFGGAPLLYKVQLLTVLDPTQDSEKGAAILQKFAEDFCSVFQQRVLPKNGS